MDKKYRILAAITVLVGYSCSAIASPVTVSEGTSSATLQEDFSSLPEPPSDALPPNDAPIAQASFDGTNVAVAERFIGLSINTVTGPLGREHETFSGSPNNPLALANGPAANGIAANRNAVAGLNSNQKLGEGVVSMLFDFNIVSLGLEIVGNEIDFDPPGGETTVAFYRQNGVRIDELSFTLSGPVTFSSTQPFRGVALSNLDASGQGYDNLRFEAGSAQSVPAPATLPLLALGLVGLGAFARWRTSSKLLKILG